MASSNSVAARQGRFGEPHEGVERHKLDRLRELRAVIDTLRHESEALDSLLAWVVDRDRAENRQRD